LGGYWAGVLIAAISVIWYIKSYSETDQSRLTLFGNIDIRQVQLTFHDPEHIAQMYVKEGDQVTKGQLLAIQDLARFQYTLDSAQAKMDAQQQVVNRLLNGTRPEDIRRAKADVKSAQAEVAYTKKELQRLQSLVKKKLTSKESVDRARSEYNRPSQNSFYLDSYQNKFAHASLDGFYPDPVLTHKLESVDRARSEYIAAREKMHALQEQLDLAVIGPRKEDIAAAQAILKANESSLKLAKKVWQDGHLYAPSDGIIQDRILEPGDMANSQSPIYTLALVNPVWARVYVSEQDLGKIHQGMRALAIQARK
jgi:HlyD family secretion protein